MTADLIMLFLYLLVHFIVVSLAVLIGLWLFYVTEWVLEKLNDQPHEDMPGTIYHDGQDDTKGKSTWRRI